MTSWHEDLLDQAWKIMGERLLADALTPSKSVDVFRESRLETARWTWDNLAPSRFHDASLDDLDDPRVVDPIRKWLSEMPPKSNLLLLGPVGTGKTHAAWAIIRHMLARAWRCEFMPIVKLFDGLRPDGGLTVDKLAAVDLLVIDDLGAERPTDWTAERLSALVDRRWNDVRPTIATSNLAPDALERAIGPRAWSRFAHGSIAVQLVGGDRRRGGDNPAEVAT